MTPARDEDGNLWDVTDPNNPVLIQAAAQSQGPMTLGTPDPTMADKGRKIRNEANASDYDPALAAAELAAKQSQAASSARTADTQASAEGRAAAKFGKERQSEINTLRLLQQGIDNLDKIYKDSFAGKGFQSIGESYAPGGLRPANEQLNTAANSLSSTVARALQLTGQQFNTPAEAQMFIGGMLPKNNDPDEVILDKILRLKNVYEGAAQTASLGGEYRPRYDLETGGLIGTGEDNANQAPPSATDRNIGLNRQSNNLGAATTYETIDDPTMKGVNEEYRRRLAEGLPAEDLLRWARGVGISDSDVLSDIQAQAEFRQANPGVSIDKYDTQGIGQKNVPLNLLEQGINSFGRTGPGTAAINYTNAAGFGIPQMLGGERAALGMDQIRDENPLWAFGGDVAGVATGTGALAKLGQKVVSQAPNLAVKALSDSGRAQFGRGILNDAAYGAIYGGTTEGDPLTGALAAGGGSFLGQAGGAAIAPIFAKPANAMGNTFRNITGRPNVPFSPKPPKTERLITSRLADDTRGQLAEAHRFGLPMAIADTNPQLRALSGSATRKSPAAREFAEVNIEPRALGQADRAQEQIATQLTAPVDPKVVGAEIRKKAQDASRPYYDDAFSRPAPVNDDLAAILENPELKSAFNDAARIAANEGKDPRALGFDFNEAGDVIGVRNPSWETLDLMKRGLDQQLAPYRDPFGRLNLEGNPLAQSIEGLRQRFVATVDNLPGSGPYKQARATYAEEIAPRTSLGMGSDAFSSRVPSRDVTTTVSNLKPNQVPTYQQGYATRMADQVDNSRLVSDPYKSVYGSTSQREKLGTIFPQGAPNFGRVYDIEQNMAKTAQETLGGSQTATRLGADAAFENGAFAGNAAEIGLSAATGVPPVNAILQGVKNFGTDGVRLGLGKRSEQRAADIAPYLLNPDPVSSMQFIDEAMARQAAYKAQQARSRRIGGIFGAPIGAGAGLSLVP